MILDFTVSIFDSSFQKYGIIRPIWLADKVEPVFLQNFYRGNIFGFDTTNNLLDVILSLTPVDEPAALTEAVLTLSADPNLRAKLGAGATAVADQFTWDKIASQTIDFFQELIHINPHEDV